MGVLSKYVAVLVCVSVGGSVIEGNMYMSRLRDGVRIWVFQSMGSSLQVCEDKYRCQGVDSRKVWLTRRKASSFE